MDAPEAVLRLLLGETEIQRLYQAPEDYDPAEQGEWDTEIMTFGPHRPIKLVEVERSLISCAWSTTSATWATGSS